MQLVIFLFIFNTSCMCRKIRCDGESCKVLRFCEGLSGRRSFSYDVVRGGNILVYRNKVLGKMRSKTC